MLEQLVGILIKTFILVTLLVVVGMNVAVPNSEAQPTWELYENNTCGISLKHPYVSDLIIDNSSSNNSFQIHSFKDSSDPDSLDVILNVSCIDKAIPISNDNMELAKSNLLKDFNATVLEDISFNKTTIDGERAGSVAISSPGDFTDISEIDKIIESNHLNQTYIIKLKFTGDEGISGFYNNYKYLDDNLIDSIKFSQ